MQVEPPSDIALDRKIELSPTAFLFLPSPRYDFGLLFEKINAKSLSVRGSSIAYRGHLKEIPIA